VGRSRARGRPRLRRARSLSRRIVAEAHYQLGDLRRQRGDLSGAEEAFRTAHGGGRDPQPGLALLRLAQGRAESAAASIQSALATEERDPLARARLLPAAVEIALAAGDIEHARAASEELAQIARTYGTAGLAAASAHARGAVLLADGGADKALQPLREALRLWQELRAPYEAACVRVLMARAHEALHDRDSATLEREAARAEFVRLGAPPETGAVALAGKRAAREDGLTNREAEILGMVAAGQTNQQIAADLVLSIRTVERHLATVYQKLGLRGRSARAAAVSYALREGHQPPSDYVAGAPSRPSLDYVVDYVPPLM